MGKATVRKSREVVYSARIWKNQIYSIKQGPYSILYVLVQYVNKREAK